MQKKIKIKKRNYPTSVSGQLTQKSGFESTLDDFNVVWIKSYDIQVWRNFCNFWYLNK